MASKDKKTEVTAPAVPESIYVNRELSWLAFNQRVLLEAADPAVPLLERLKFLMIYQSNLAEFYRVRIGILTHRTLLTPNKPDPLSGMLPDAQIREVLRISREQQALMESIWKAIREELRANQVDVLDFKKINKVDELMSKKLFGDLRNLLFPKFIDVSQGLPFLWDGEANIIAFLGRSSVQKLCVIPLHRIPAYLSFEVDGRQKIVLTAQLVRHFLPLLLKKESVLQSAVVEVTRNADVFLEDIEDRADEDFRHKVTTMLTKRKREVPVRVRIYGKLSDPARALLIKKLRVPENRVFTQSVPFDLSFRSCIGGDASLHYEERRPARNIGLKKGEYFAYIEKNDLLLSYPFQSMLSFVDLIYEAADDPEVLSLKITLYRMSSSSRIAAALAYAADRGKDVLCLLELRARFDEQNNIDYSEMLEDAGCRVIYGLPNHKVHSKLCVITRRHEGNLSYVTQVGTGNYNEVTGEQYTDLSLITAREEVGREAEAVFAALAAGELPPETQALWIAPLSFKSRVLELLDREIAKGENGRVAIKVNAMNNRDLMEKLIECSRAGVRVELFIRGICSLRPGVPGLTEHITVSSVVGRWLEHSRVYSFGEGADQRIFIGSGDLLNRNLERRVEAFLEAVTPDIRQQLNYVLDALRADREKASLMQPDGSYRRFDGGEGTSSQEALYRYFSARRVSPEPEKPAPIAEPEAPAPIEEPEEPASVEEPEAPAPVAEPEAPAPIGEPEASGEPPLPRGGAPVRTLGRRGPSPVPEAEEAVPIEEPEAPVAEPEAPAPIEEPKEPTPEPQTPAPAPAPQKPAPAPEPKKPAPKPTPKTTAPSRAAEKPKTRRSLRGFLKRLFPKQ
ncbi:MAG: polyphosphate kinase 1 [Oscillospiraceae bacterium]|nr:polyphosphate kinase 1 [Oscillospiraceae bacterium]